MNIKKIYSNAEALVSDDLINSSDAVINARLPHSEPGYVIYTAGYAIIKHKSLDNKWVAISSGSGSGSAGADGKDGVSITSVEQITTSTADGGENVIQVTLSNGTTSNFTVKNGSKGSTGAAGAAGAKGEKGDKGDKGDTGATGSKGDKGDTGAAGAKGADGKTPVKGTDYWTEADKQEIINAVVAAIKEQETAE